MLYIGEGHLGLLPNEETIQEKVSCDAYSQGSRTPNTFCVRKSSTVHVQFDADINTDEWVRLVLLLEISANVSTSSYSVRSSHMVLTPDSGPHSQTQAGKLGGRLR